MTVDAHVFYWSQHGMSTTQQSPHAVGYVQVGEVERLLEEAHRLGSIVAVERAMQIVRDAGYHVS